MAIRNPHFSLAGLSQFKKLNLPKVFEDRYRLVTAYPMSKKIRFVLENVTIDSLNEDHLIFITLNDASENILPIEVMRGGQEITLSNLVTVTDAKVHFSSLYIDVSEIIVGDYVMSSGDNLSIYGDNQEISESELPNQKYSRVLESKEEKIFETKNEAIVPLVERPSKDPSIDTPNVTDVNSMEIQRTKRPVRKVVRRKGGNS